MTVPNNADEIRSMMKVGRREERKKEAEFWQRAGFEEGKGRAGSGWPRLLLERWACDVQEKQRCQPLARRDDARALLEGGLAVGALTATTLF
jgi:hypothetical protein